VGCCGSVPAAAKQRQAVLFSVNTTNLIHAVQHSGLLIMLVKMSGDLASFRNKA